MDWVWQRVPGNDALVNVLNTRMRSLEAYLSDLDLDDLYYTESEVDALLANKSDTGHTHDTRYYTETEVDSLLAGKSDTGHIHDGRYYTEAEVDSLLGGKSDTGHAHDTRYYTETEVDSLLAGKSDTTHLHDSRYYTQTEVDNLISASSVNELADLTDVIWNVSPATGDFLRHNGLNWEESEILVSDLPAHNHDTQYYTETEVDNLLAGKADATHSHGNLYYTETEVDTLLAGKSDTGHIHDDRYYTESEVDALVTVSLADLTDVIWNVSPATGDFLRYNGLNWEESEILVTDLPVHTHDSRYYTETETDSLLAGKSDTGHSHGNLYYTETEVDTLLAGKSDTGHIHDSRYYTESEVDALVTTELADLTDVVWNVSPATGDFLRHNGVSWEESVILVTDLPTHTHTEAQITDLGNYALVGHTHDTRYYTETEVNNLLAGKSDTGHNHDTRYYTQTQVDGMVTTELADLSDVIWSVSPATGDFLRHNGLNWEESEILVTDLPTHTHTESQITDLGNYALVGHNHPAGDITSGTFLDARIAQSNVTQHQSALSIAWNQITGEPTIPSALGDMSDVVWSAARVGGDFLRYNGTLGHWEESDILVGDLPTHTHTEAQITDLGNYALAGHTHPWADITGEPVYTTRWPSWTEVTAKPATFPPDSHTHGWTEVTAKPATATRWPSHAEVTAKPDTATRWPAWSEVTSKPLTFTPSSHNHPASDITSGVLHRDRVEQIKVWREDNVYLEPNDFPYAVTWKFTQQSQLNTPPGTGTWAHVMQIQGWSGHNASYPSYQLVFREGAVSVRQSATSTTWGSWRELAEVGGHSHLWADITGEPVYTTRWPSWTEVTSKPATFTPSAHTHPWADITGEPDYTTRWPSWTEVTSKPLVFPPDTHNQAWSTITSVPSTVYASAARPGPTRLYRGDSDTGYYLEHNWTGAYWYLRGYNSSDIFHAEVQVGRALDSDKLDGQHASYFEPALSAGSFSGLDIGTSGSRAGTFYGVDVNLSGDITIPYLKVLYLDGGGDTYIQNDTTNRIKLTAGADSLYWDTGSLFTSSGNTLGNFSNRWSVIYGVSQDLSGNLNVDGTVKDTTYSHDYAPIVPVEEGVDTEPTSGRTGTLIVLW